MQRAALGVRAVVITAALLAPAVVAGVGVAQVVDEAPAAFGVRITSVADIVRVKQTPAVQGPTPPTVLQMGASDVVYDDVNGQISAFSSTLYPSDLGQCPTCLLGALGFPVGQQLVGRDHPLQQLYFDVLPAIVPQYPLVTRASVPGDPGRKFNPIGDITGFVPTQGLFLNGVTQDATANPGFAAAETVGADINVASLLGQFGLDAAFAPVLEFARPFIGEIDPIGGALVRLEGVRSRSSAVKADDGATVQTSGRIGRVQVLGGLLEIADIAGSITRTLSAENPTDVRTTEQTIEIGPAKVAGIGVVFEGDSVRVRDTRIPAGATGVVESLLNTALQQAGITLRLPRPATAGNRRTAVAFGATIAAGDTIELDVLTLGSDVEAFRNAAASLTDVPGGGAPDLSGAVGPSEAGLSVPAASPETPAGGSSLPGGAPLAAPAAGQGGTSGASDGEIGGPARAAPPIALDVISSLRDVYSRLFLLAVIAAVLVVGACRRRTGARGWRGLQ